MSKGRLAVYLDHIQQAASDACSFVEGLTKENFLADKRTQQAVIMSLIIVGEAATRMGRPSLSSAILRRACANPLPLAAGWIRAGTWRNRNSC